MRVTLNIAVVQELTFWIEADSVIQGIRETQPHSGHSGVLHQEGKRRRESCDAETRDCLK